MKQEKKSVTMSEMPPGNCLAPEKISAFLDGEEEFTAEEEAHFYSCPACQKLFRSYRAMGGLFKDALEEEVKKLPDAARILEKVHEKLHKEYDVPYPANMVSSPAAERKTFLFTLSLQNFARVAAVFLFLLFSFLLLMQFREKDTPVLALGENESAGETFRSQASPLATPFSSVDINSLIPVVSGRDSVRFLPQKESGAKSPVLIPFQVKQLWIRPHSAISRELEKLSGIPLRKNGKEWILKGEMTRKKVVELVKKLAGLKYKLLTPVAPQPEDTLFLGTGNEKVQLLLTFLPEA